MTHRLIARPRRVVVATIALAVLTCCAASASARNLSVTNQRFRMTWSSLEFNPGRIRCAITLEGSFSRATFAKVREAAIGGVYRHEVNTQSCSGGFAEPFEATVAYRAFAGTLPSLSSFSIELLDWTIVMQSEFFAFRCVARTSTTRPAAVRANVASALVTSLTMHEELGIPFLERECLIFGDVSIRGEGRLFVQGTTSSIGVRLI